MFHGNECIPHTATTLLNSLRIALGCNFNAGQENSYGCNLINMSDHGGKEIEIIRIKREQLCKLKTNGTRTHKISSVV